MLTYIVITTITMGSIKTLIAAHAQYNHWANSRIVNWLRTLDSGLLQADTPSSFRGIGLTLQHMVHAQNFWLRVIMEKFNGRDDEPLDAHAGVGAMHNLLEGSERMMAIFSDYSEEELLRVITHPDVDLAQPRYAFVLHVINHNTYHRGQIVTMARALGVTDGFVETDYDTFLWSKQHNVTQ